MLLYSAHISPQHIKRNKKGEITTLILRSVAPPKHIRISGTKLVDTRVNAKIANPNTCPVRAILDYSDRTRGLRDENFDRLFVQSNPPHQPISPRTATKWIWKSMEQGGIDMTEFAAHSIVGAGATDAIRKGVSCDQLLSNKRWKSLQTPLKHYIRV